MKIQLKSQFLVLRGWLKHKTKLLNFEKVYEYSKPIEWDKKYSPYILLNNYISVLQFYNNV